MARVIPNIIPVAFFVIVFFSCVTTNRVQPRQPGSAQVYDTLLVDGEGNRYSTRLMAGNNLWMTTSLKLNIPGSFCYENLEKNCEQYGRLYTWESAQKGCTLLGKGWHLPTNEDWQQMAKPFGGIRDDSQDNGNAAYAALMDGGTAAFNVLLGGGRDLSGNYARQEAHGFFWTATENDISTAWMYNFGKGSLMLNRHKDGEKSRAFSVRCLKNLHTSR